MMRLSCIIFFIMVSVTLGYADPNTPLDNSTIVFVCEHGSAKSVVAAAYFNRIAQQQGLRVRSVSRGTTPDTELAPAAVKGLQGDGIPLPSEKPTKLTPAEASVALRVIAFCDLPGDIQGQNVERWTVPAISEDYTKARDAIIRNVKALILSLKKAQ